MITKYKFVLVITSLLALFSISLVTVNYYIALNSEKQQIKSQALSLSIDNINNEIQRNIIEPYLISSLMAHDTFVENWLADKEVEVSKIADYLFTIKEKYQLHNTFLVSTQSLKYYTMDGFIDTLSDSRAKDQWFYDFMKNPADHEINLDYNKLLSTHQMMFINYKIRDHDQRVIGVTGIALEMSKIDHLLKEFIETYKLEVRFFDRDGSLILPHYTADVSVESRDLEHQLRERMLNNDQQSFSYFHEGEEYLARTKFIDNMGLYLGVTAKISDFTQVTIKILYINILTSLSITLLVSVIVMRVVKLYSRKLEYLSTHDELSGLANRRHFKTLFELLLAQKRRAQREICLLFLDIDDFKRINDNFGHLIGDEIIKRLGVLLLDNVRRGDIVARWGGEEFAVVLDNAPIEHAAELCERVRKTIAMDKSLCHRVDGVVTASIGLTEVQSEDQLDDVFGRADEAMYASKSAGKNRITIL